MLDKIKVRLREMGRYRCRLLPVLLTAIPWHGPVAAAPITFNTALPVAEGEFVVREQFILDQSGVDPVGADRERRAKTAVSVLGYGLGGKLAVFGVLPYHDNRLDATAAGQRRTRSASGLGDVALLARYTLVQRDGRGHNFRVAPIAGIKAPTGDDDQRDAFGRLPASVQPGSGSWDPFAGVVMTVQTLAYQIDSQFGYRVRNAANGFEAGDEARLDASLQYRMLPRRFTGGVPDYLYGVLEVNFIHQRKNRIDGTPDPDSGGTRLFVTPGIQYVSKRWIAEAALQLPVSQDLNGTALETDYIGHLSVRFNF